MTTSSTESTKSAFFLISYPPQGYLNGAVHALTAITRKAPGKTLNSIFLRRQVYAGDYAGVRESSCRNASRKAGFVGARTAGWTAGSGGSRVRSKQPLGTQDPTAPGTG